jgi:hypothetical protein
MKIKTALFITVSLCAAANGATEGNRYADENRELFTAPKSAAMGGADVSFERSALPLSNPSNLAKDSLKEAALAYAGYFQNTFSVSSMSFIAPVDTRSGFGLSLSYRLIPDINLSPSGDSGVTRITSSPQLFFRAGYGRSIVRLNNNMEIIAGAAINGERRDNVDLVGYGIGLDIGANLLVKNLGVSAGIVVENATTSYIHWTSEYKNYAYPHARLGLGWQHEITYIYGKISAAYLSPDLFSNEGINSYGSEDVSASDGYSTATTAVASPDMKSVYRNPLMFFTGRYGLEYAIINRLAFRAGYSPSSMSFSFGAGLCLMQNRAGIDFAYLTHELAPTYKLSVNFKWL